MILKLTRLRALTIVILLLTKCTADETVTAPDIGSLQQGIRVSALIGYCSPIVVSAHKGLTLPSNVDKLAGPGLLNVRIDNNFPLPFNRYYGNIKIASLWNVNGGIMSILLIGTDSEINGLYAVPFIDITSEDRIQSVFASEDIIIGNGSDTLLDLSTVSGIFLNSRLALLEKAEPDDPFVAVKQNVWIVNNKWNQTSATIYDDEIMISGGGQIAEVKDNSGGVVYHAMIKTRMNYLLCSMNPVAGFALSQNFKAGGEPLVDLGNSLIRFHSQCDGKAHVEISTGKYYKYTDRDISLGLD